MIINICGGPIGGGGPTGGGPTDGGMPTACVGCTPSNPGPRPSDPPAGQSSDDGRWIFHCYDDGNGLKCYWFWVKFANRLVNPCGGGNVVAPPQKTPCQKTKEMLENPKTKPAISFLKANSSAGREKGVMFKADGTPSAIIQGGEHSVNFGDKSGYQGGYHNHTPTGTPMFSPGDFDQLLNFALGQGNLTVTNAYLGMVARNGMHYIIRFNGSYNDALVTFSDTDLKKYRRDYREIKKNLMDPEKNGSNYINADGSINNKGVEKLFFEITQNMNLSNKISLQRIENNGNVQSVQSINLDANNQPIPVPCS
ncbi:hypothetical protein [Chryseobacterium sp. R2A-55]|uniref:hypothetical protein n=1 Tax=Chryseobacterium sp. R2A-55 TaxID=2744445 RepID=UPI001F205F40|nr:hypothetical protein [Chryseobacterium sp. R2A-55]